MLEIDNLCKNFINDSKKQSVLDHLTLTIEDCEFFVLLGKSGCGKTTFLRCIGGFLKPDAGSILLNRTPVTAPSKDKMMVFQSFDQLFPWLTLKNNIMYAVKKANKTATKAERSKIAEDCLKHTGLSDCAGKYPSSLSGGMKQRGALARALALKPDVLLMDEPFSSLDSLTRHSIRQLVRTLAAQTGCMVVLVTHDIEEAAILGDKIGILDHESGRISRLFLKKDFKDISDLTAALIGSEFPVLPPD